MRYLTLLLCMLGAFGSMAADKPNVVLLLSDDHAWYDYSFMGHPHVNTPHLDQLASESVLFPRGYVPTALCRPSLMTLATGHYAHRHGVTGNDPSSKDVSRDSEEYHNRRAQLISYIDEFDTLPELLGEQGYLSHQSGKWWEGNYKRGGFTHGMTRGFPEPGGRHGDDGLKIGREGLQEIYDFVDMALEEEKPFYLWYAAFLPHTPHNPPERLLQKYRGNHPLPIAKYFAMIEWWDETCGELIGFLEDKNIRNNTLIIYVGDNGWIQNPEQNGFMLRSKQSPYEGGTRQPTMYSWPARFKPAHRLDLVSSTDIFPTVLAAAGARQPSIPVPGTNLLPSMEGNYAIDRNAIFGEGFAHDIVDLKNPQASLLYRWCIRGDWKLLLTYDGEVQRNQDKHPRTEKRPQLFNLKNDPHEKTNLAGEHPEKVTRMVKMIDNWWSVTERKVLTEYK